MNERNSSPPVRRGFGGRGRQGMMPTEKVKDARGTLRRFMGYLKPQMWTIIIVILIATLSVIFMISAPKILGRAINLLFEGIISKQLPLGMTKDQAIAMLRNSGRGQIADMIGPLNITPGKGVDFNAIFSLLAILAGVYILSALFHWLQQYLMAGVAQKTVYKLRKDVDTKLTKLPLRYYDNHSHGDILSIVTNDIDNISHTLQQTITQIITAMVTIVGVIIMMFSISGILTWITLAVIPVALIITTLIARHSRKQFFEQWNSTGSLNGHIEEMFTGHNIVKVFNREKDAIETFDKENERVYNASFKAQFLSGLIMPLIRFLNNINYVIVCVFGGIRVANGILTLGDVQAFIQYSRQFTQPISQTASIINTMQSSMASAERVFEVLDEKEETPDTEKAEVLEEVKGHVRFEHVYFRYLPDVPLFEDFNLDVRPAESVAIVGHTGAGKTTLVNLLMRFYEIDSGCITIDGVDTRKMTRDYLRSLFGMVLQDTWFFEGTIKENIAYGKEGATEEEIMKAAKAAYVDHFVRTLPEGYDTIITADTSNISEGQKQLITIARAFLSDPKMLILDEATSSVDTRTEVLVQKAMSELMQNRTSFVIAHRLSTIRNANNIVVVDKGRIVEQGNHQSLMAAHRFYYDLYMSQFSKVSVEEIDHSSPPYR